MHFHLILLHFYRHKIPGEISSGGHLNLVGRDKIIVNTQVIKPNEQYLSGKMSLAVYLASIQHDHMSRGIPFQTNDWDEIPFTEHPGKEGTAWWKTIQFGDLRIRKVKYEPGYIADHWCRKGHIIYCIEGEMTTETEDGAEYILRQGMTYMVSDNLSTHRSRTKNGVTLFIVDGGFLNINPSAE
jgi:hypothetical protein